MKKIITLPILSLILILVASCSVQKSKSEKDGLISKAYHNVTAHYNGYYNAEVLLDESILTLNDQQKDNYTKILPVYKYVAADNPAAVAGNLDEAIKKVTVVTNLHPESNWSDDCYLLAAKAQYVKQDYESAEETLLYMLREFSPEAIAQRKKNGVKRGAKKGAKKKKSTAKDRKKAKKKRQKELKKKRKEAKKRKEQQKKERERRRKEGRKNTGKDANTKTSKEGVDTSEAPKTLDKPEPVVKREESTKSESYFMKHRPAFQEGQLWMARTFIERASYSDAERFINLLDKNPTTFKDIKRELAPVKAHFHIKQKQYAEAIEPLKEAIELGKNKQLKARYAYILAQIYQRQGDSQASQIAFEQALKFSNNYDMEFSAKLNIVKSSWEAGTYSSTEASKRLNKMTKDVKNYEYRDQIYFLLATIALKDNDDLMAIDYLRSSLKFNEDNTAQKAEAYLQLADLYFEKESFIDAKLYYDSTLQVLPKTDERYSVVNEYANNLTDIANNLVIIETQDSLLNISRMSPEDQKALAFKLKKEQDDRAFNNLKKQPATLKSASARNNRNKSTYWAYNDKALKKGLKDFKKKWGDRPLEDNWRRSQKNTLGDLDDETFATTENIDQVMTDDEVKAILKDVPKTPEEIAKAEEKIQDAMMALGILYRDRLENNPKTVAMLTDLENKYPETKHQAEMYYFLYLAHTDLGNTAKAKEYYNKLINKHPDTNYARVLSDPDFLTTSNAEEKALMTYYDETYTTFEKGQYTEVAQRIENAVKKFGAGNKLQAKFALLSAMTQGNINGKEAYKTALREVVGKYPNTPEEVRAKEILKLLGGGGKVANTQTEKNKKSDPGSAGKFKVDPEKLHYFIVVITGGTEVSLTDAKNSISDYNREFHKLKKLRISPVSLGDQPMIVMRRFKSQEKAMDYYNTLIKNQENFLPEGVTYELYPITQSNYRTVLKGKSLAGYPEFFDENYLN